MGGHNQDNDVYYASIDELTSTTSNHVSWQILNVPNKRSSTVTTSSGELLAVGGITEDGSHCSSLVAYTHHTKSWLHVGDMPIGLSGTCLAILPTGEIMIIGGDAGSLSSYSRRVFKGYFRGKL